MLVIPQTFADAQNLFEADLDNIKNALEDFFNLTKITEDSLQTSVTARLIPSGTVVMYASVNPPPGWLNCDGAEISKIAFAVLYGIVGDAYFTSAGAGNFNLPNFSRFVPMGEGGTSIAGPGIAVGDNGGSETHVLTSAEMPSHHHAPGGTHVHAQQGKTVNGAINAGPVASAGTSAAATVMTNGTLSAASSLDSLGNDDAHNNVQPCLVVNFIIKT